MKATIEKCPKCGRQWFPKQGRDLNTRRDQICVEIAIACAFLHEHLSLPRACELLNKPHAAVEDMANSLRSIEERWKKEQQVRTFSKKSP